MPSDTQPDAQKTEKPPKKWTIMVFCAGDNELSPMIVSQLKDLKDAGPHKDVNVVVYFDPNESGVPTRLYSINQNGKNGNEGRSRHFDTDVHNLISDNVIIRGDDGSAADKLRRALERPDQITAKKALSKFLNFCKERYNAQHYALVLLGHGMIVGNDAFLPDESPLSSITLKQLGKTLDGFGGKLELLAMHSCSMSAVEVAYELKGKANYMMASEGLSFVQGWPYRKLLKKTFEVLNETHAENDKEEEQAVQVLIEDLYKLSSYNGLDFMLSGYSQDLALINLHRDKFLPLTEALKELVIQLKAALENESNVPKQLIQLAHLESQSYYNENYTDLYDFCYCLSKSCGGHLQKLKTACDKVMEVLESNNKSTEIKERFDKIVIHSRHFGSLYQHSHGLSIYFPWTKPLGDAKGSVLNRYNDYTFTDEFIDEHGEDNSWLSFLNLYLEKTKREPREAEVYTDSDISPAFGGFGLGELSTLESHKTSGASGPSCSCISIKNFPTEEREFKGKKCLMRKLVISRELNIIN